MINSTKTTASSAGNVSGTGRKVSEVVWDVHHCVSAVTEVEMPVFYLRSNLTDKGSPYELETHAERCHTK